jgi:TonB family protein
MILSVVVLFLSMLPGKAAVAVSLSEEKPGNQHAADKAGKTGARSISSAKHKPIIDWGPSIGMVRLDKKVTPVYPELAILARVEGEVILIVSVDEEGNVTDVRVSKGHPFLNDMAVNAVSKWKYTPMMLNGEAVPVRANVTVKFSLDDKSTAASGKPRIDPAVAEAIMLYKAGKSVGDLPFIHEGNANLELKIAAKTANATSQLKSSGFEIIAWPEGSPKATGKIAVEKLESLLKIKSVQYIAPHLR